MTFIPPITFIEYRYLVLSDLFRIYGNAHTLTLVRAVIAGGTYKYNFWMRTAAFLRGNVATKFTLYPFARFLLDRQVYRFGISIPDPTKIGSGFYIGHFSGIIVNDQTIIGKNCNISQGVTIGRVNRGSYTGIPTIGNNVYIGPGAKIIGKIHIGNNVAIGANCVVTRDVPDNSVVVGIPGRVISDKGSFGYINHTEYDAIIDPNNHFTARP
jgi:serine O-acetyltransferase